MCVCVFIFYTHAILELLLLLLSFQIDGYLAIWVMFQWREWCRLGRSRWSLPEELDPMKSLFERERETVARLVMMMLIVVVPIVALCISTLLSICARVFAARRLWSCCGHGTDCRRCLRLVSAAAAADGRRALPHRVKRSQPDVGDVAVVVVVAFPAAAVVADCGPGAAARSPCTL